MIALQRGGVGPKGAARPMLPPLTTYLEIGRSRGISWTELRREVLTLLWRDGGPWGPYGLADEMRKTGNGVYPNSLYRVLNTLEEAGLIVSIASSRRVQIAPDPEQADWAVLQCTKCDQLELVPFSSAAEFVRGAALELGHGTERLVIECMGRCRSCQPAAGKGGGRALADA
jgi:Fur family transcriptional regulator, zinc uptake regulator